jgi:dipeptidyl aminopeptidase/acylaminoacyl peptidase
LILQGKDDERCPRGQAEELFTVLRRCSRAPAEMVLYPGGDHHFFEQGKPSHRLDALRRSIGWLERWIDRAVEPERAEPRQERLRRAS